jgi:molybdopterin biosynthesis enzyme
MSMQAQSGAFWQPELSVRCHAGRERWSPIYQQARPINKVSEYQRGTVTRATDGSLQVKTTDNQGSGVLSSMVQANGLIVLHLAQGNMAVGDVVDVLMLDGAM